MHLLGLGLLPPSVMPSIKHTRSRTLLCSAFLLFHTRGSQAAPAALLAELTHALLELQGSLLPPRPLLQHYARVRCDLPHCQSWSGGADLTCAERYPQNPTS